LGVWNSRTSTPAAALIVQGLISLALVWLGVAIHVESGFETMVAYTTPVFWFFFFLVGVALFVLRRKDPDRRRVFSVPFYPVTPFLFCLIGLYMLKNGFDYILLLPKIGLYSGLGAAIGVAVLLLGVPFWLIDRRLTKSEE
jgi:amino acid transporter